MVRVGEMRSRRRGMGKKMCIGGVEGRVGGWMEMNSVGLM